VAAIPHQPPLSPPRSSFYRAVGLVRAPPGSAMAATAAYASDWADAASALAGVADGAEGPPAGTSGGARDAILFLVDASSAMRAPACASWRRRQAAAGGNKDNDDDDDDVPADDAVNVVVDPEHGTDAAARVGAAPLHAAARRAAAVLHDTAVFAPSDFAGVILYNTRESASSGSSSAGLPASSAQTTQTQGGGARSGGIVELVPLGHVSAAAVRDVWELGQGVLPTFDGEIGSADANDPSALTNFAHALEAALKAFRRLCVQRGRFPQPFLPLKLSSPLPHLGSLPFPLGGERASGTKKSQPLLPLLPRETTSFSALLCSCSKAKVAGRRLVMLTNDENPLRDDDAGGAERDVHARRAVRTRLADLGAAGIQVSPYFLPPASGTSPALAPREFDLMRFWADALGLVPGDDAAAKDDDERGGEGAARHYSARMPSILAHPAPAARWPAWSRRTRRRPRGTPTRRPRPSPGLAARS
jgi:hypothetical protein